METAIRKAILAGIGAVSVTKDKVEELFDELVAKGQASKDDKAKFVRETMEKAEQRGQEAKEWINKQVEEALEKIKPKTQERLDEISKTLEVLNSEVHKLTAELDKMKKTRKN